MVYCYYTYSDEIPITMTEEEINLNQWYAVKVVTAEIAILVVQKRRIDGPWHVEAKGVGWFNIDKIVRKV
jgi:hypothetical protein